MGLAVGQCLVVHAVIGHQTDNRAQFDQPPHAIVDRPMEGVCLGSAGGVRMLDIVRQ